ncbi:MAG TPA: HEPN domain-containing protein [Ignavibacteriaceae bacterium]|nr:HEPN domain-containing protein [Ignavibacteriaceae bacterium]
MQVDRKAIVRIKINSAKGILDNAERAIKSEELLKAAIKIYEAIFISVSALALKDDFLTSSHAQLFSWFNENYIMTGIMKENLEKFYLEIFQMYQKINVDEFVDVDKTGIKEKHLIAVEFLNEIISILDLD